MITRRQTLKAISLASGAILLPNIITADQKNKSIAIGIQHYTWHTFFIREDKQWNPAQKDAAQALLKAGYDHYEPSFGNPQQVKGHQHLLDAGIKLKSFYVNSTLHDKQTAKESIESVLATAEEAKKLGAEIVVTNPTPIAWGSDETKTDEQLYLQAEMLEILGSELRSLGMTLGYHTHDPEMKRGAREFHHMLVNTSPENVKVCLDTHWIFRGTGDSELAMFDIVKMYGDRIVELHLRQSDKGVWSETFAPGDINYVKLVAMLKKKNINPYLVVEQAVEKGTPYTMDAIEANQASREYVKKIFGV
ncbi:MAG: sugar phosphate isomerase/epimerase family protein [Cyclobacteriaceae bacterium]